MSGLVDFALVEFADDRLTGRAAEELMDLHDRGIIQVHHMVVVGRRHDGEVYAADLGEAMPSRMRGFANAAWARTDLLADVDMRDAAAAMKPGHIAVLVIYQITWALPFGAVAEESRGELLASGRIPADDLSAVLTGERSDDTVG
jgi:Family of unknown function (DUF6325)